MNIVMMGIQGCGKGTQGKLLADHLNLPHISTGDVFRQNIAEGTELGKKVQKFNDGGKLIPDNIVNDLVRARLEREDTKQGFILDGFPRNGVQLAAMEYLRPIDHAVLLELDDKTAIDRLLNRMVCHKCDIIYGLDRLPKKDAICDKCGSPLRVRADDKNPESVKRRIERYHQEIDILVRYYEWKNALRRINAKGEVWEVFEKVLSALSLNSVQQPK